MPKKRSMPHGRSVPKAKKERQRLYTSPADEIKPTERSGAINGISTAAPPARLPAATPPRSAIRYAPPARTGRAGPGLITDYRYVVSDLRRIAILATGTFVILGVLTFIVR